MMIVIHHSCMCLCQNISDQVNRLEFSVEWMGHPIIHNSIHERFSLRFVSLFGSQEKQVDINVIQKLPCIIVLLQYAIESFLKFDIFGILDIDILIVIDTVGIE